MSYSSDEIIKREIIDTIGYKLENMHLRIFPESSTDDQKLFSKGGLTFDFNGVPYGSCDACWYVKGGEPIIALEGTDALNRKSSGNAQYQRFHHALGAVKNGLIGIYYLRKGIYKIQEDLYGMAYNASQIEAGVYLIINDLNIVKEILSIYFDKNKLDLYLKKYLNYMFQIYTKKFKEKYNGNWDKFADERSTIIKNDYIIKYAGRMKRNFTDSSQRAGHIAVGEMYLTKYFFYDKKFYYLFPKMTKEDLKYLDENKSTDKEWYLLRNEPNVEIKTIDDIKGINPSTKNKLLKIKDIPLKGTELAIYNECVKEIAIGLKQGGLKII